MYQDVKKSRRIEVQVIVNIFCNMYSIFKFLESAKSKMFDIYAAFSFNKTFFSLRWSKLNFPNLFLKKLIYKKTFYNFKSLIFLSFIFKMKSFISNDKILKIGNDPRH